MATIPRTFQVDQAPAGQIQGQFAQRSETPPTQGGATGRAIAELGARLQEAGGVFAQQAIKEQELLNETEAAEATITASQQINEQLSAFLTQQGRAASEGFDDFQRRIREAAEAAGEGASNQRVRQMLRTRLAQRVETALAAGRQHSARETLAANQQAQSALAGQAITDGLARVGDPAARGLALRSGLEAIDSIGRLQGWDEATLQQQRAEYIGRFYSAVVAEVAQRDPLEAQRIFEANRSQMDAASQLRIQEALSGQVRREVAAARVREAASGRLLGQAPAPGEGGGRAAVRDAIFRAENPAGDARQNPLSSASGPGQITNETWRAYAPRLGLTDAQRNDRAAHERIFDAFMDDAERQIGRRLNPGEMYAAWLLGIGGARAFFAAPRNANAREVYRSVASEERTAQAFSSNGDLLRPNMTVGQVLDAIAARVESRMGGGAPTRRDYNAVLRDAMASAEGDVRLQAEIITQFNVWRQGQEQADAQAQAAMTQRLREITQALSMGSNVAIPEADIRRVFTPEQAERHIADLRTAEIAGQIYQSVQSATPAELNAIRDDLVNGNGPISQLIRLRRGTRLDDYGQVVEEDRPTDIAVRGAIREMVDRRIEQRNRELLADPAQYVVNSSPQVRAALDRASANPSDQQAMRDYITATLAEQERLGVPPEQRRVLSVAQAQAIAADIMRSDPGQGNAQNPDGPVLRLRALAMQYGEQGWPLVFRDLVRDGRLPREYEVLANIASAVGQADYARMLAAMQQMGGADRFRSAVRQNSPVEAARLTRELESYVRPFVNTALASGQSGGDRLADLISDAVLNLAYYYVHRGQDAGTALQRAADRIINDRYEISGTMRVPKTLPNGQPLGLQPVRRSINYVMSQTRETDIADPPDDGSGLPMDVRRQIVWRGAQRGMWVPNSTDTGLIWVYETLNGGVLPVRRRDGSIFEIRFDNLPQPSIPAEGLGPPRRGTLRGSVRLIEGWEEDQPQPPAPAPQRQTPPPVRDDVLPGEPRGRGTQPRSTNRWEPPR